MVTLTKENKRQILGNKSFSDNEPSLIAKLFYIKGIGYFDTILSGKSQNEINAVIHLIKFPKGIEIKLAKLFKSYSVGVPYNDISEIIVLRGANSKIKLISNSIQIEFSFKETEYFDVSNFFVKELKLIPKIAKNENEFESNLHIIETKESLQSDKKEVDDNELKGEGWIIAGYIFAILGGLIGIFIGRHLSTAKVKTEDGSKKFKFAESSRMHGDIISIMAMIMIIFYFILRIIMKKL